MYNRLIFPKQLHRSPLYRLILLTLTLLISGCGGSDDSDTNNQCNVSAVTCARGEQVQSSDCTCIKTGLQ